VIGTLESEAQEMLLFVLGGLVPLHLMKLANPAELARAQQEAALIGGQADVIAEAGDRLTAAGNFSGAEQRRIRGQALSATARAIALGAMIEGGITWCGTHWCTAPHDDCPNRQAA
jgi:hypothetical protein